MAAAITYNLELIKAQDFAKTLAIGGTVFPEKTALAMQLDYQDKSWTGEVKEVKGKLVLYVPKETIEQMDLGNRFGTWFVVASGPFTSPAVVVSGNFAVRAAKGGM